MHILLPLDLWLLCRCCLLLGKYQTMDESDTREDIEIFESTTES